MEHLGKTSVVFDYTSFLGASCSKKWTFLEAMSTFAPIFSLAWKNTIKDTLSVEDRLWDQAMKSLSANRSDESNIATLLQLAKSEGVEELKLVMPYELDVELLERLKAKSKADIKPLSQDELFIKLQ
ncbi:transporter [Vibrio tubiashii]|uniref:transporter n=1 Tax=Vibrio tubiashii TaxID=29498 RepID=UPI00234FAAFC|nr:transporter [Vibrio tubiashii]WCP65973.1 transporter [Vibrio tubiashii]